MSSTLAIQIGGFILALIAIAVSSRQVDRVLKQRDQAFKDQGAPGSLGLGTCLSGLPGLHQTELVSCGATATELIFLADEDCREVGRIPWRSIVGIFGGVERESTPLSPPPTRSLPWSWRRCRSGARRRGTNPATP